jgi:hypothetical protein
MNTAVGSIGQFGDGVAGRVAFGAGREARDAWNVLVDNACPKISSWQVHHQRQSERPDVQILFQPPQPSNLTHLHVRNARQE